MKKIIVSLFLSLSAFAQPVPAPVSEDSPVQMPPSYPPGHWVLTDTRSDSSNSPAEAKRIVFENRGHPEIRNLLDDSLSSTLVGIQPRALESISISVYSYIWSGACMASHRSLSLSACYSGGTCISSAASPLPADPCTSFKLGNGR